MHAPLCKGVCATCVLWVLRRRALRIYCVLRMCCLLSSCGIMFWVGVVAQVLPGAGQSPGWRLAGRLHLVAGRRMQLASAHGRAGRVER